MPMYFPDLKSIRQCAENMRRNIGAKQYKGIYPESEEQLPQARKELGRYFREVWGDVVAAIEVERAVTRETYEVEMLKGFLEP